MAVLESHLLMIAGIWKLCRKHNFLSHIKQIIFTAANLPYKCINCLSESPTFAKCLLDSVSIRQVNQERQTDELEMRERIRDKEMKKDREA